MEASAGAGFPTKSPISTSSAVALPGEAGAMTAVKPQASSRPKSNTNERSRTRARWYDYAAKKSTKAAAGGDRVVRREDAERFIEEVRGDDPELGANLRIEERELEAGGRN